MKTLKTTLAFLSVALLGTVAWALGFVSPPEWLIGAELHSSLARSFLFEFFGLPFSMAVTFVAGLIKPKLFWLWGIAIALPVPILSTTLAFVQINRGVVVWSNVDSFVAVSFLGAFNMLMVCTATSALGAGLRWISHRSLSHRAGGVQNGGSAR